MVLGDGARDRGALADQISPLPYTGAGVGYVRLEASPDPVRVRAAYVSPTRTSGHGQRGRLPARRWPMRETAWRTDEPCPVCQTGLVLVDTGGPVLRAECRLCGYAGPFDTDGTDWDGDLVTARADDAGRADGRTAGPAGGQGPGRRARRLPAAGAAAPDRDRHRPRRAGPHPVRAHPGLGVPVVRRAGPDPAGRAMPRRLAPGPRTRHRPGPGDGGPAGAGHRPGRGAGRPGPAGQRRPRYRATWTSGSASWTSRSPIPGFAARSCLRGRAATAPPGAARTPLPCPAARSTPGRSARPTPRRTARPSGPRCSSR